MRWVRLRLPPSAVGVVFLITVAVLELSPTMPPSGVDDSPPIPDALLLDDADDPDALPDALPYALLDKTRAVY